LWSLVLIGYYSMTKNLSLSIIAYIDKGVTCYKYGGGGVS